MVNRLAHAEPGVAASLADLAAGLRAAEEARDGRRLRDLSSRRQSMIDGLAQQALALAGLADPPPGLRAEVTATLGAALASQEVADQLATGTLTHAAAWSGFGLASQLTLSAEDVAVAGEQTAGGEEAVADERAATQAPPGTGEPLNRGPRPVAAAGPARAPVAAGAIEPAPGRGTAVRTCPLARAISSSWADRRTAPPPPRARRLAPRGARRSVRAAPARAAASHPAGQRPAPQARHAAPPCRGRQWTTPNSRWPLPQPSRPRPPRPRSGLRSTSGTWSSS